MEHVDCNVPENCRIYVVGDLHIGSIFFKEREMRSLIKKIEKEPNSRIILMGDLLESIKSDDKRFHLDNVKYPVADPLKQANFAVDLFKPIRDKILVSLKGNHEHGIHRTGNIMKDVICKQLNVPYGTLSCILTINDSFEIYCWHGSGMIRSRAEDPETQRLNEMKMLKRKLQKKYGTALVQLMGHAHKLIVSDPSEHRQLYLTIRNRELKDGYTKSPVSGIRYIETQYRWYGCSGCFKGALEMGTDGYEELADLDPTELGYLVIHIRNNQLKTIEKVTI
jgi:hypothetical protein